MLAALALACVGFGQAYADPLVIDLADYFPTERQVGDYRKLENSVNETQATETTTLVEPWRTDGLHFRTELDDGDGKLNFSENYIRNGKLLRGNFGDSELWFRPERPERLFKLRMEKGETQIYKHKATVIQPGKDPLRARFRGTVSFDDLVSNFETPPFIYSEVAQIRTAELIVMREPESGARVEIQGIAYRWYAAGMGEVASSVRHRVVVNGVVVQDSGVKESWITEIGPDDGTLPD